jgi:kynurenine formamidase
MEDYVCAPGPPHTRWGERPVFENVPNVRKLPSRGFSLVALPMKIEGGSGGPLRIMAVLRP